MRPQPSVSARLYDRSCEPYAARGENPQMDDAMDDRPTLLMLGSVEPPPRGASRAGDAGARLRRAGGRRRGFEPAALGPARRGRADVPRAPPEAWQRPRRGGARALDPAPATGAAPGHRACPLAVRFRVLRGARAAPSRSSPWRGDPMCCGRAGSSGWRTGSRCGARRWRWRTRRRSWTRWPTSESGTPRCCSWAGASTSSISARRPAIAPRCARGWACRRDASSSARGR